jgi:teichuronic acid biosynthesis glycosyltransferase TuaG
VSNSYNLPIVSVITPFYNSQRFIKSAIQSVCSQTYKHWIMYIIDDGSTDDSVTVIKKIIKNEPRIQLIRLTENIGAAQARNAALEVANSRFVAFLDSDDIWYAEKLEKQVSFMLKNKYPISFTSYKQVDQNGKSDGGIIRSVEKLNQLDYLKNTVIGFSTSMIDTKYVGNDFRFIDIRTRQDTSLWISMLGRGFVAYGMPEVLADYRIHSNSISANKYRAAKQVWNLYFNIHHLGFIKSVYYFIFYTVNAIKKRI